MEKYNYFESVCEDIRQYIEDNEINVNEDNRQEIEEQLNDDLFVCDSVTGNASGSYTFNTWKAEEYLCHNLDLLAEACGEFGSTPDILENAEGCDVTIRCYLLNQCISHVLDEILEN